MKFLTFLFLCHGFLAYADSSDEQQQTVIQFYEKVLPKAIVDEQISILPLQKGHTEDGSLCAVHTTGSVITMIIHPDMTDSHRTNSDIQFDWDPRDVDSNIIGIPVSSSFEHSPTSLEATLTAPTGYGLNRFGIRITIQDREAIVSIRDRNSFFSHYYDCRFSQLEK